MCRQRRRRVAEFCVAIRIKRRRAGVNNAELSVAGHFTLIVCRWRFPSIVAYYSEDRISAMAAKEAFSTCFSHPTARIRKIYTPNSQEFAELFVAVAELMATQARRVAELYVAGR